MPASGASDTDGPSEVGVDVGGTFTDFVVATKAGLEVRKVPTTDPQHEAVGTGLGRLDVPPAAPIAHVDAGGSLRVGPESAGAEPGPVCYGRGGTRPTVTDAHLTLGRLDPDRVLGGTDALNMAPEAARSAVGRLGETLGRSPEETALGVLRVANATMERALRRVSVERGHDPRDYTLVPFGGAGPLHAAALAEALGMPRVLVPPAPGALSALGLLMADVTHDASRALLTPIGALQGDPASIQRAASALTEKVESALEGHGTPEVAFELDLRYVGQSYEVTVPLASPVTAPALGGAAEAFHDRHRRRYGHAAPEAPVEAVALRARGTVPVSPPPLPREPETDLPLRDAEIGTRPVWFSPGGPTETTAYARTALHHGHTLEGPAVLHQYDTTIVVPPGWRARVDAYRNVWIER